MTRLDESHEVAEWMQAVLSSDRDLLAEILRAGVQALSQALPNDRMIYVIIRTPGKADLILLPKQGLTPPALVAAFDDLAKSRTREPAPDRAVVGIGTRGGQKASTTVGGDGAAPVEYASLVQQIRAAPLRPLRNLGAAQWIEVAASEFGL